MKKIATISFICLAISACGTINNVKVTDLCCQDLGIKKESSLDKYSKLYSASLSENVGIGFLKEADYKERLDLVRVFTGTYVRKSNLGRTENRPPADISIEEKIQFDSDGNIKNTVSFDDINGTFKQYKAFGRYKIAGQVLRVSNLAGDAILLSERIHEEPVKRCIIIGSTDESFKMGCDSRSYSLGGDLYVKISSEL